MSKPMKPVVSVVTLTYNRLAYLKEAVSSVLAQTRSDWELIIVDDGSTDGTREWLAQLTDERIRVVLHEHSSWIAHLYNSGLDAARADWIAFVDSDDRWHPDKLEKHLAFHAQHPQFRWSYTAAAFIDGQGKPIPQERFKSWRPFEGDIVRSLLVQDALIALPTVMAQRSLLLESGGFDESLSFTSDYDLWLRLASRASCGAVPERLTYVRQHAGSRTRDRTEVNESFMKIYDRFAARSSDPALRRICRRQRAAYAVFLARQRLARREWEQAAQAAGTAFRLRAFYPWAWMTLGKAAVKAALRRG